MNEGMNREAVFAEAIKVTVKRSTQLDRVRMFAAPVAPNSDAPVNVLDRHKTRIECRTVGEVVFMVEVLDFGIERDPSNRRLFSRLIDDLLAKASRAGHTMTTADCLEAADHFHTVTNAVAPVNPTGEAVEADTEAAPDDEVVYVDISNGAVYEADTIKDAEAMRAAEAAKVKDEFAGRPTEDVYGAIITELYAPVDAEPVDDATEGMEVEPVERVLADRDSIFDRPLSEVMEERAGCVMLRRIKRTNAIVGVYRNADAGLDDAAGKWSVVCDTHGAIQPMKARMASEAMIPYSPEWCSRCYDIAEANRNGNGAPRSVCELSTSDLLDKLSTGKVNEWITEDVIRDELSARGVLVDGDEGSVS